MSVQAGGAPPEVFADRAVREAIALLREHGITAEQYATVQLVEQWKIGDVDYPDREAALAAARQQANDTGAWVEVWLSYGPDADGHAESWIIKPEPPDALLRSYQFVKEWHAVGPGRWRGWDTHGRARRYAVIDGECVASTLVAEEFHRDEQARTKAWARLTTELAAHREGRWPVRIPASVASPTAGPRCATNDPIPRPRRRPG